MSKDELILSVVCMLAVDGKIDELEMQFLNNLCKELGVSREVVQAAFEKLKQGQGKLCLPEKPEMKPI